jgi:hypothetical protein
MDYFAIICAAVGGGIGGGLGALIAKNVKNKTVRVIATVVPVVLFAQLTPTIATSLGIRERINPKSNIEIAAQKHADMLKKSPKFVDAIKAMSASEAQNFSQEKAKLGLRRLSTEDLENWNRIRLVIAVENAPLCAGFWTGKMSSEIIQNGLSRLPAEDIDVWMRLSMTAAKLEIEAQPVTEPDPAELQNGIKKISTALSPRDLEKWNRISAEGAAAADADACWAMMTILRGAKEMSAPQRAKFLKALAAI